MKTDGNYNPLGACFKCPSCKELLGYDKLCVPCSDPELEIFICTSCCEW